MSLEPHKDYFPSFEACELTYEQWLECYNLYLKSRLERAINAAKIIEPACYQAIVTAARSVGYAVAVHGSRSRDVDLLAMPWTEDAVDLETLAKVIAVAINGYMQGEQDSRLKVSDRPHGRKSLFVFARDGTIIDLSVMPRIEEKVPCPPTKP